MRNLRKLLEHPGRAMFTASETTTFNLAKLYIGAAQRGRFRCGQAGLYWYATTMRNLIKLLKHSGGAMFTADETTTPNLAKPYRGLVLVPRVT